MTYYDISEIMDVSCHFLWFKILKLIRGENIFFQPIF